MLEKIIQYIEAIPGLEFAYLYGSYAEGKELPVSDIDIGILCRPGIEILQFGRHIVNLENIANRKIDLVQMNILYKKSPVLAYQIITTGKVIIEKNKIEHSEFKLNTYKYYFDTEYLRREYDYHFLERFKSGNFGKAIT